MDPEIKHKPGILLVSNFLFHTSQDLQVTRGVCDELFHQLKLAGWPVIQTSSKENRFNRLFDIVRTIYFRRKEYSITQVDVYSGMAFIWAEVACWALHLLRKPYILTLHGGLLPTFAERWPKRVRRLLQSAGKVTTPSTFLFSKLKIYRAEMTLLPNPLHIRNYPFNHREKLLPRLIWLRAFHHVYNPTMAIDVVLLLIDQYPNIELIMVGPDKGDGSIQKVKQKINKHGLENQVHIQGKVQKKDVPSWLNRGDIFLNTSTVDNAPVSIVEAMACGLCVVSTNVGGIPYLLSDGKDAILVESENAQEMANAVQRFLKNPKFASSLSLSANLRAAEFDWSIIFPRWESLFQEVLSCE